MRFGITLAVVIVVAATATAYSQGQPKKQEAANPQQQTQAEQRGTPQAPFVIQIQPAEQTQNKTGPNASERQQQRGDGWFAGWNLSDKIAAIATGAAAAQFVALVFTIIVMVQNGRRQLRAYVLPDSAGILDGTMLTPPQPARANIPGVILMFRNSGQTPAYKVISWAKIEIAEPINEDQLVVSRFGTKISHNFKTRRYYAKGPLV